MNQRHSPGLTEEQCDAISERTAMFVMRQVKPLLRAAGLRELQARMSAGQQFLDPFYAFTGPAAGAMTAVVSTIWGMMEPDEDPAEQAAAVRKLMHAMVDVQLDSIFAMPPGDDIKSIMAAEGKRKRGMT
jgi:hypothetical protein